MRPGSLMSSRGTLFLRLRLAESRVILMLRVIWRRTTAKFLRPQGQLIPVQEKLDTLHSYCGTTKSSEHRWGFSRCRCSLVIPKRINALDRNLPRGREVCDDSWLATERCRRAAASPSVADLNRKTCSVRLGELNVRC
jgi:hypothetical protein